MFQLRHLILSLALGAAICVIPLSSTAEGEPPALDYEVDLGWPTLPPGLNFGEVAGIAADSRGHAFVFHRGPHPIMEFDPHGAMVRSWGDGLFIRPHSIRVDPEGNIWTVDNDTHQVLKMDPGGHVRMVVGSRGQAGESEELFNRPTDVGFAPNGDFYVTDGYGNSRVVRFSKEGRFKSAWGTKGDGDGQFDMPHAIVVDRRGRVYVGDRENYRVQIFDASGKFLAKWTHVGSPWGLQIVDDETIYLADGYNNRILLATLDGEVLGAFGTGGRMPGELSLVHHIGVDGEGNVFAAEIRNQRAQRFARGR